MDNQMVFDEKTKTRMGIICFIPLIAFFACFVYFGDGAGVLLEAFDQQFFVVGFDADEGFLFEGVVPVVHHDGFIFRDG